MLMHGLILLLYELFRIVISFKIVDSLMRFKFFHKIFVIQNNFLLHFNLLRGPDTTRSGADPASGPRVVYPCSTRSALLTVEPSASFRSLKTALFSLGLLD